MTRYLLFFSLMVCSIFCFSQKYIKPYVGINFSSRFLTSDNTVRKDSLDKADKIKAFPTAGIQFIFEKKQGREFYFGMCYNEVGFVRERLDYKFNDTVHSDLGQINDLSQAAQKNGYFTYHFKYLEFPIGFNFQLSPRRSMNTYTSWFNIGITPQFLIKQNMTIFLQGFSIKGKSRFDFSKTGYNAAKSNLALQAGSRFDYYVNGKFWVTTDALVRMQLLQTATSPNEKLRVWNLSLNLGIRYEIGAY